METISYIDVKRKKPCSSGYIWFLEKFGKEVIDFDIFKSEAFKDGYGGWVMDNFFVKTKEQDLFGKTIHRDISGIPIMIYMNGANIPLSSLRNHEIFKIGMFLPTKSKINFSRFLSLGIDGDYLYYYDTLHNTDSNIFLLIKNIDKVYMGKGVSNNIFFDLPLYVHFPTFLVGSERVERLEKKGYLKTKD